MRTALAWMVVSYLSVGFAGYSGDANEHVPFFSTRARNQPIAIELSHALPGFGEVLPRLHKGEKAILWPPASAGTPEPVVYEVEVVDILSSTRPRGA